jgi:hypothetical protein
MSTPTSLSAWPAGSADSTVTTSGLEPSGLTTVAVGKAMSLYMASDNGKIARYVGGNTVWQSESFGDDDDHDYESVTTVTGELMVGIEGGAGDSAPYSNPGVMRFDPADTSSSDPIGDFTKSYWELQGMTISKGGGMEAFAFIPQDACPSSWGTASYYGGFFLAASQGERGTIYVYDLPQGGGNSHVVDAPVTSFTDDLIAYKVSDICYSESKGLLLVLFDDTCRNGASTCTDGYNDTKYVGALQILQLDTDTGTFVNQAAMKTPYVGCEALTCSGDNIYIGLDQTSAQFTANGLDQNYVLEYKDFLSDY